VKQKLAQLELKIKTAHGLNQAHINSLEKAVTSNLQGLSTHVLPAGTDLWHGARRRLGQDLLSGSQWLTSKQQYAEAYCRWDSHCPSLCIRKLIKISTSRDLLLLVFPTGARNIYQPYMKYPEASDRIVKYGFSHHAQLAHPGVDIDGYIWPAQSPGGDDEILITNVESKTLISDMVILPFLTDAKSRS